MKNKLAICFLLLFAATIRLTAQTTTFNTNWKFYKGDIADAQQVSFDDNSWRKLELPHDWSIEGPFSKEWASGTGYLPAGIGWYRKTFDWPTIASNDKVFIYFDGVYKNSEVWLNGHSLGKRPNGYIAFQYEMTPYLQKTKNVLAVKVDHTQFADSRWYPGSGIYRNVYLVVKKSTYIPTWGVSFTTPQVTAQKASAEIKVAINNSLPAVSPIKVESKLSKGAQVVATASKSLSIAANSEETSSFSLNVNSPKLWSTDDPQLYTLTVSIFKDGKKIDGYETKVGFRDIKFDANEGFFLNGKNTKLKGVCIHHDAGALGAAVPRDVWKRRLKLLKDVGCNSIRMSHYPHQDYIYDLCDEMGFLVMDEAFDEWEVGKNKWIEGWNVGKPGKDGYNTYFKDWAERDVKDMVLRNRNHPSIIMWSIGNEIDYPNDPYSHEILNSGRNPQIYGRGYLADHPAASRLGELSKMLVDVVKQNDNTRPVTAALAGVVMSNTTTYPGNLDLVGYNYQEYRYPEDHKAYPSRIIYGSENSKGIDTWKAVDTSKNIFGQFLWTGYDFVGEARQWPVRSSGAGLLDMAGFPKTDYYIRQTLWSDKPMIYLTASKNVEGQQRGRRISKPSWNWAAGDKMRVTCITNTNEAELFLNGKSLGKKTRPDSTGAQLVWNVDYEPGELIVRGYSDSKLSTSYRLKSSDSTAVAVAVDIDKKSLSSLNKEVAHVVLSLIDKNGNAIYEASNELTVTVTGPAKLIGLESGDLSSHEDYKSNKRKALNGKLLAYVQAGDKKGPVTIMISSPGVKDAKVTITVTD